MMNRMNTRRVLWIFILVIAGGAAWFVYTNTPASSGGEAKYTYVNASEDLIKVARTEVFAPSKIRITGSARGYWYFEASFPVSIRDSAGRLLAQHYAEAQGEWMTEDFVPFVAEVEVSEPLPEDFIITLHKDNPSGDPERDASVSYPFRP
jgi:hypothetical protein